MGKRKSNRKPPEKKSFGPLATVFSCPFCNNEKSCFVTFSRAHKVGRVECRECKESFETPIHALSEAVDVYAEWYDEITRVNKEASENKAKLGGDNDDENAYGYQDSYNAFNDDDIDNVDIDNDDDLPETQVTGRGTNSSNGHKRTTSSGKTKPKRGGDRKARSDFETSQAMGFEDDDPDNPVSEPEGDDLYGDDDDEEDSD